MSEAITRRELLYHVPGQGNVRIPAGSLVQVIEDGEHTPQQLAWLQQVGRKRRTDEQGRPIPGPQLQLILFKAHPDGWTSVPDDDLAFPVEGWDP